jgi:rhodanese-related sulfurtransferase
VKIRWLMLILVMTLFGCAGPNDVPLITKEELKAKLGSPGLVILDVRSVVDWGLAKNKIVGARRVDLEQVETWAEQLPKDKEIVLYCG